MIENSLEALWKHFPVSPFYLSIPHFKNSDITSSRLGHLESMRFIFRHVEQFFFFIQLSRFCEFLRNINNQMSCTYNERRNRGCCEDIRHSRLRSARHPSNTFEEFIQQLESLFQRFSFVVRNFGFSQEKNGELYTRAKYQIIT